MQLVLLPTPWLFWHFVHPIVINSLKHIHSNLFGFELSPFILNSKFMDYFSFIIITISSRSSFTHKLFKLMLEFLHPDDCQYQTTCFYINNGKDMHHSASNTKPLQHIIMSSMDKICNGQCHECILQQLT
jgi:hypothetical protein